LISRAYGIEQNKVLEGPSWLEMDRFEVIAKLPPGATPETQRSMLQALLADRFQLKLHHDTRPMPAYALIVGKHPALKKAAELGATGCKSAVQTTSGQPGVPSPPMLVFTCRNMTMAAFAQGMQNMVSGSNYLRGTPVVDRTKLEGAWDFDFRYNYPPAFLPAASAGSSISLFDAVEKLGLKLDPVQVPMP